MMVSVVPATPVSGEKLVTVGTEQYERLTDGMNVSPGWYVSGAAHEYGEVIPSHCVTTSWETTTKTMITYLYISKLLYVRCSVPLYRGLPHWDALTPETQ